MLCPPVIQKAQLGAPPGIIRGLGGEWYGDAAGILGRADRAADGPANPPPGGPDTGYALLHMGARPSAIRVSSALFPTLNFDRTRFT